jgi:hypothetical protein
MAEIRALMKKPINIISQPGAPAIPLNRPKYAKPRGTNSHAEIPAARQALDRPVVKNRTSPLAIYTRI